MEDNSSIFWHFLIRGNLDDHTGVFGNFYTYAEELGEAIDQVLSAAEEEDFKSPVVVEITRSDLWSNYEMHSEAVNISDSTLMIPEIYTYKIDHNEKTFSLPTGVAFDRDEHKFDTDLIRECFEAKNKDEKGTYHLKLTVDHQKLSTVFPKCLEFIEPVSTLSIFIHSHWQDLEKEHWQNSELTSNSDIASFLNLNKKSIIDNGYLDLHIRSKVENTGLMLCEHKMIQFFTNSEELYRKFIKALINIGYKQTIDFYSLEAGYHHWHYRPTGSLDRGDFIIFLQDKGFEKISSC